MLDTIVSLILIALVTADLVTMSRSNAKLRKQLLELATQRAAQKSVHEITIACDNSDAIDKIKQVELAAHSARQALEDMGRAKALH